MESPMNPWTNPKKTGRLPIQLHDFIVKYGAQDNRTDMGTTLKSITRNKIIQPREDSHNIFNRKRTAETKGCGKR
jgi:hypothetical protein